MHFWNSFTILMVYIYDISTMQKVFIPRNISGWWFNMSVQLWPFSISIIQLMTLAVGMWLGLWIWNVLFKNGVSKTMAFIVAIPIFMVFVFGADASSLRFKAIWWSIVSYPDTFISCYDDTSTFWSFTGCTQSDLCCLIEPLLSDDFILSRE